MTSLGGISAIVNAESDASINAVSSNSEEGEQSPQKDKTPPPIGQESKTDPVAVTTEINEL